MHQPILITLFALAVGLLLVVVFVALRLTKTHGAPDTRAFVKLSGHARATPIPNFKLTARSSKEFCEGGFEEPKALIGQESDMPDRVVCISLPYRQERRDALNEQLKRFGIAAEPFLAVVGRRLRPEDYDRKVLHPNFSSFIIRDQTRRGHLGATWSHTTVYQSMIDQHSGPTLIFEDDAYIHEDFREQLKDRMARVAKEDPDWDVLLLGFSCSYGSYHLCHENDLPKILGDGCLMNVKRFMGLWGYVINGRKAAQKIMRNIFPQQWAIDHHLCNLQALGQISIYGCVPAISYHPGQTTVSSVGYSVIRRWDKYVSDTNL